MGADAQWVVATFPPDQQPPDGYEVGGEWGELSGSVVGYAAWYWTRHDTMEIGPPRETKWEALRDAIAHAASQS